jgi:hypothetical protein
MRSSITCLNTVIRVFREGLALGVFQWMPPELDKTEEVRLFDREQL